MKRLTKLIIIIITSIINFNIVNHPHFNSFEGEVFDILITYLPGDYILYALRIITFLLTLSIFNWFINLQTNLKLKTTRLIGLSLLWFSHIYYKPFASLSWDLLLTGILSIILILPNKLLISILHKRFKKISINTTSIVTFDKEKIINKNKKLLTIVLISIVSVAFVFPDFSLNSFGITSLCISIIGLILSTHRRNSKMLVLTGVLFILTSSYILSLIKFSTLISIGSVLTLQYVLQELYKKFKINNKTDIIQLINILIISILIFFNVTNLSNRWNDKPNQRYLEISEFYQSDAFDSSIPTVFNNNLIKNNNSIAYSDFDLTRIGKEQFYITIDKTINDNKSERIKEIANNYIPVFESKDGKLVTYLTYSAVPDALNKSWEKYKEEFITNNGQTLDKQLNLTTSESQSYAMWRAAIIGDKEAFDLVWEFTKNNLQVRNDDNLLAWKGTIDDFSVLDFTVASDADIDTAYSLLQAYNKWGEEIYLTEAQKIIADIWDYLVFEVNETHYLGFSEKSFIDTKLIINPSYFAPYAYKAFAEVDDNDWVKLTNDTYKTLDKLRKFNGVNTLPPNWVAIETSSDEFEFANDFPNENKNDFGFDAFRTFFRVALDYQINKDQRAADYLNIYLPVLEGIYQKYGYLPAIVTINGSRVVSFSKSSTDTALVSVWSVNKEDRPKQSSLIFSQYNDEVFGEIDNYYDQNWGWFSLALHEKEFINN